jgi:ribose 1,5-bisphosphate isomerase
MAPERSGIGSSVVHADLAARVERIAADTRHGSSWLAKEALEALVEAVQIGEDPLEMARDLVRARPAIGSIAGALGRVLVSGRTPEQLIEEAHAVIAGRERAAATIAVLLSPELTGKVVMTHSASATAREALVHAQVERVVCTVSEPVGEGRRFSEELAATGLATDLVADEDAAHAAATVDLLLLGADTVFRDGSLVNKIKTNGLATAAKKAGVPVVVACEVLKLAPVDPYEPDEERVDLTPPSLIDRYATEEGIFAPDELAALVDRTPFLREGYELLRG